MKTAKYTRQPSVYAVIGVVFLVFSNAAQAKKSESNAGLAAEKTSKATNSEPIALELNLFEDKDKGYSLLLPKRWKARPYVFAGITLAAHENQIDSDKPLPRIFVQRSPHNGISMERRIGMCLQNLSNFGVFESDKMSDAGEFPTRKLIFVQKIQLIDYNGKEVPLNPPHKRLICFVSREADYIEIHCLDFASNFERSLPIFNKIVDSLNITKR